MGFRVGVDDSLPPYVCTSENGAAKPISWGSGPIARRLYENALLEMRAEGIRMVPPFWASRSRPSGLTTQCGAVKRALCATPDGQSVFLPAWWPPIIRSAPNATLSNIAVRKLASDAACERVDAGKGRRYEPATASRYDVSLCDVIGGQNVLIYDIAQGIITVTPRPTTPLLYSLMLSICVVLLFGMATTETDKTSPSFAIYTTAVATALLCATILRIAHPTYYLSDADGWYGIFSICSGFVYLGAAVYKRTTLQPTYASKYGGCIHALDCMVVALYNTPETPFSAVIAATACVRMWSRFIDVYDKEGSAGVAEAVDLAIACAHGALMGEFGVRPQVEHPTLWAATLQTVVFIGFVWARYRPSTE